MYRLRAGEPGRNTSLLVFRHNDPPGSRFFTRGCSDRQTKSTISRSFGPPYLRGFAKGYGGLVRISAIGSLILENASHDDHSATPRCVLNPSIVIPPAAGVSSFS